MKACVHSNDAYKRRRIGGPIMAWTYTSLHLNKSDWPFVCMSMGPVYGEDGTMGVLRFQSVRPGRYRVGENWLGLLHQLRFKTERATRRNSSCIYLKRDEGGLLKDDEAAKRMMEIRAWFASVRLPVDLKTRCTFKPFNLNLNLIVKKMFPDNEERADKFMALYFAFLRTYHSEGDLHGRWPFSHLMAGILTKTEYDFHTLLDKCMQGQRHAGYNGYHHNTMRGQPGEALSIALEKWLDKWSEDTSGAARPLRCHLPDIIPRSSTTTNATSQNQSLPGKATGSQHQSGLTTESSQAYLKLPQVVDTEASLASFGHHSAQTSGSLFDDLDKLEPVGTSLTATVAASNEFDVEGFVESCLITGCEDTWSSVANTNMDTAQTSLDLRTYWK